MSGLAKFPLNYYWPIWHGRVCCDHVLCVESEGIQVLLLILATCLAGLLLLCGDVEKKQDLFSITKVGCCFIFFLMAN